MDTLQDIRPYMLDMIAAFESKDPYLIRCFVSNVKHASDLSVEKKEEFLDAFRMHRVIDANDEPMKTNIENILENQCYELLQ